MGKHYHVKFDAELGKYICRFDGPVLDYIKVTGMIEEPYAICHADSSRLAEMAAKIAEHNSQLMIKLTGGERREKTGKWIVWAAYAIIGAGIFFNRDIANLFHISIVLINVFLAAAALFLMGWLVRLYLFPSNADPEKDLLQVAILREEIRQDFQIPQLHANDKEQSALDILRKSENAIEITSACIILQDLGTIRSLPVLIGRLEGSPENVKVAIYQALTQIGERYDIPAESRNELFNPDHWKLTWAASPELFLSFVRTFTILVDQESGDDDIEDRLGEIFLKIINVDLTPYHNFQELKLCSKGEDQHAFFEGIKDKLQSELLVKDLLADAGLSRREGLLDEDLYSDLQNDYMVTRLMRYIDLTGN